MKPILLFAISFKCCVAIGQTKLFKDTLPVHIQFAPTQFYNAYDTKTQPALRIRPGDTVSTESLDALGFDKDFIKRGNRGNPLTGPFYIEGALPGDVLAITITKLSLNRQWATTLSAFIPKILPKPDAKRLWRKATLVKWRLDLANNTASPAKEYEHLASFKVPLRPFLGSVGVAPGKSGIASGGLALGVET